MDGAVAGSIVALDGLVSLPSKVPRCQVLVPLADPEPVQAITPA